jgi:hypothetical protein
MGEIKDRRMFSGREFVLLFRNESKTDADYHARQARARGYGARILKQSHGKYEMWRSVARSHVPKRKGGKAKRGKS